VRLRRTLQTDDVTFGELLTDDGDVLCKTLELPWRDNQHGISCIPPGSYTAKRRFSAKHGYALFGIEGVPDRSDIEIHVGNFPKDSLGCVLVGSTLNLSPPMVTHSVETFRALMAHYEGVDEMPLEVTNPEPLPPSPEIPNDAN